MASLGGLHAVTTVLKALPENFPVPVVVIQHGRREGDALRLARLLSKATSLPVRTVASGAPLGTSGVVVVPTGPVLGERAVGVVLTGMLDDGADGVRVVKRHGGRVLVQDPVTARAAAMPAAAMATGCVDSSCHWSGSPPRWSR